MPAFCCFRETPRRRDIGGAGWSSPVARQAHNLKVVGSNPTPATNNPLEFHDKIPFGVPLEARALTLSKRIGSTRTAIKCKRGLKTAVTRPERSAAARTASSTA